MSALVHLMASAIAGVVFGLLVAFTAHHLAPVAGALWGAFYGVTIWLVRFVLFLPWLSRERATELLAECLELYVWDRLGSEN